LELARLINTLSLILYESLLILKEMSTIDFERNVQSRFNDARWLLYTREWESFFEVMIQTFVLGLYSRVFFNDIPFSMREKNRLGEID